MAGEVRMRSHRPPRARRALFDRRYVRDERRRSYRMAFMLFWSVLLAVFFQRHVISVGIVEEHSMAPTLPPGEHLLVNRYVYRFAPPRRGDIITLGARAADTEQYVKRVIALPGDLVQIREGRVFVNQRRLDEPYAVGRTEPSHGPHRIAPDHYFVLGDNREVSQDSRHFGPVARRHITGRVGPGQVFTFF